MDSQGLTDSVNMSNVSWRLLLTSGYQARADRPEERCLCMLSHGYSSILKEIFSKSRSQKSQSWAMPPRLRQAGSRSPANCRRQSSHWYFGFSCLNIFRPSRPDCQRIPPCVIHCLCVSEALRLNQTLELSPARSAAGLSTIRIKCSAAKHTGCTDSGA